MKDFLPVWAIITAGLLLATYLMLAILFFVVSFITWNTEPLSVGMQQIDWVSFRIALVLSAVVGFFVSLGVTSD